MKYFLEFRIIWVWSLLVAPGLSGNVGLAFASEKPKNSGNTAQPVDERLAAVVLKDVDGNPMRLSDAIGQGRPVLLSFWATWCTPCKKELTNYLDLYEDWAKGYGLEILAVSIDDARNSAKVKSYIKGVRWPYRILMDPNEDMKRILNFQTVPYTLLYDGEGRLVYRHNSYVEGDEFVMDEKIRKLPQPPKAEPKVSAP